MRPAPVKALLFDVGGTVFDWHGTVQQAVERLAAERGVQVDAGQFARDWRQRMFELLGQVRRGTLPWMNADAMHRRALDELAAAHPALIVNEAEREALTLVWHRLRVWPDAPAALEVLRSRYIVVVLTVLSWASVVQSSKEAGLVWDGILSCEFLGHYKPDREAYLAAVRLLGLRPEEAMMVAAHPGDLRAAMAAGLRAAYVHRPAEQGEEVEREAAPPPECDVVAEDFPDLVRQLVEAMEADSAASWRGVVLAQLQRSQQALREHRVPGTVEPAFIFRP